MKRRLIQHSIVFIMFTCVLQVTGKMYVGFSEQHTGNKEPVKSMTVWTLLSDTVNSPGEILSDTEQRSFASTIPAGLLQWSEFDNEFCFAFLPAPKDGYIPLHLSDSSPPVC